MLLKTRYLLYYEYDKGTDLLAVTTTWSARRGSGPEL